MISASVCRLGVFIFKDTGPGSRPRRDEDGPHRGTVTFRSEMLNQDGEVVLRMMGRGLYGTRDAADVPNPVETS